MQESYRQGHSSSAKGLYINSSRGQDPVPDVSERDDVLGISELLKEPCADDPRIYGLKRQQQQIQIHQILDVSYSDVNHVVMGLYRLANDCEEEKV
jgi:hypothetical protein